MKQLSNYIAILVLTTAPLSANDAKPPLKPLMTVVGPLVYESDFSDAKEDLKKRGWLQRQATRWRVKDGRLVGIESSPETQAERTHHRGLEPRLSASMCPAEYCCRFSIRFTGGAETTIAPFVEFGHHVVRVKFSASDAGAVMLVDGETLKVAEDKTFRWKPGKWYHALAELKGNEFVIQFQDGPTFYTQNAVLAKPPKSGGHGFGVAGPRKGTVEIDYVAIHAVEDEPASTWTETRAMLPEFKSVVVKQKKVRKKSLE